VASKRRADGTSTTADASGTTDGRNAAPRFLEVAAALTADPTVEATDGGIPGPFDTMPTLENPPERVDPAN
jgi:hypothetical protein